MVVRRSRVETVGAKLALITIAVLLLCGCDQPEEIFIPYYLTDLGTKVYSGMACPYNEKQVLEFCTGIPDGLYHTTLNFYEGSLYSLSSYRARLLERGFVEESYTASGDVLDTTLTNLHERVRLIYQSTGTIRIVFENPTGQAHILLEEMWP